MVNTAKSGSLVCQLPVPLAIELPMFVIDKVKNPTCFINIKKLSCRYRSQRKSWMDSVLFEEWVRDVNKKFQAEGRKVALINDNC